MSIPTYEEYLNEMFPLSFEEMSSLHNELIAQIGTDPEAQEIYSDLLEAARRYSDIRSSWRFLTKEKKRDLDASRTSCHDSLIVQFNVLSRYLNMMGKVTTWRDILGDEKQNPIIRKRIGDFGCFLVFMECLSSR